MIIFLFSLQFSCLISAIYFDHGSSREMMELTASVCLSASYKYCTLLHWSLHVLVDFWSLLQHHLCSVISQALSVENMMDIDTWKTLFIELQTL